MWILDSGVSWRVELETDMGEDLRKSPADDAESQWKIWRGLLIGCDKPKNPVHSCGKRG